MPTFYSPTGNAEIWATKPAGYYTEQEWFEAHPPALEQAIAMKLAELAAARYAASSGGIDYTTGSTTAPARVVMTVNFDATSDGDTLTQTVPAPMEVDEIDLVYNDRILLTGQADATQNGIYTVSELGGALTNGLATLTKAPDTLSAGDIVPVSEGQTNAGTEWQLAADNTFTVYKPLHVATDAESRGNLTAAVVAYNATQILPNAWKCGDAWLPISTEEDLMKLATAVLSWVEKCFVQEAALQGQVKAMTDAQDVLAVTWSDPE